MRAVPGRGLRLAARQLRHRGKAAGGRIGKPAGIGGLCEDRIVRDQRGIVTIRQREDGSFTPVAIRFRALTPAEIAERDAPAEAEGGAPLAPPFMETQP